MKIDKFLRLFRKKCPQCAEGRLVTRNWIRATCVDDEGERYPASWSYYECDRCGARLKIILGGPTEIPTEQEWNEYCVDNTPGNDE